MTRARRPALTQVEAIAAELAKMDGYTMRVALNVANAIGDLPLEQQRIMARYVAIRFGDKT